MANSRQRRKRALIKLATLARDAQERDQRIARDTIVKRNLAQPLKGGKVGAIERGEGFKSSVMAVAAGPASSRGFKRDKLFSQTTANQVAKPGYVAEGVKPVRIK